MREERGGAQWRRNQAHSPWLEGRTGMPRVGQNVKPFLVIRTPYQGSPRALLPGRAQSRWDLLSRQLRGGCSPLRGASPGPSGDPCGYNLLRPTESLPDGVMSSRAGLWPFPATCTPTLRLQAKLLLAAHLWQTPFPDSTLKECATPEATWGVSPGHCTEGPSGTVPGFFPEDWHWAKHQALHTVHTSHCWPCPGKRTDQGLGHVPSASALIPVRETASEHVHQAEQDKTGRRLLGTGW